jgi:hypothetical protein
MTRHPRRRFWIESAILVLSVASLAATLIDKEWIEALTGLDPDAGSGALEWGLTLAFAAAALLSASLAWLEWRRASPARA